MTLSVTKDAPLGVFTVVFRLTDDNQFQATSQYKFIIFIIANNDDSEIKVEAEEFDETK